MRDVTLTLLMVLYPLGIWLASDRIGPRWLALGLVVLALVRLGTTKEKSWIWAGAMGLALALVGAWLDSTWPLKAYPVVVNLTLLGVFGTSLVHPPTVVERLARLRDPVLSPKAVAYTRSVTQVWCLFFALNGTTCLALAVWASDAVWAMYTGGISYILMGTLMGAEWLVRRQVKARHTHGH